MASAMADLPDAVAPPMTRRCLGAGRQALSSRNTNCYQHQRQHYNADHQPGHSKTKATKFIRVVLYAVHGHGTKNDGNDAACYAED